MSEIEVTHLPVVDFEDPDVRDMFSVSERSLVSNNYAACRKLADLLRQRPDRFGGMILPSAAVPGERTLVVFRDRVPDHLTVVKEEVGTTPTRLLPLFRRVAETLPKPLRSVAKFFIRQLERELSDRARKKLLRPLHPA